VWVLAPLPPTPLHLTILPPYPPLVMPYIYTTPPHPTPPLSTPPQLTYVPPPLPPPPPLPVRVTSPPPLWVWGWGGGTGRGGRSTTAQCMYVYVVIVSLYACACMRMHACAMSQCCPSWPWVAGGRGRKEVTRGQMGDHTMGEGPEPWTPEIWELTWGGGVARKAEGWNIYTTPPHPYHPHPSKYHPYPHPTPPNPIPPLPTPHHTTPPQHSHI
jgi:hypothetical protein